MPREKEYAWPWRMDRLLCYNEFGIGSEQKGLRAKTKNAIDEFVAIPMAEGVESLNLSVAAGVLMYELIRSLDL